MNDSERMAQDRAEVRFLRGRVRFITGGRLNASGFFASVVVIWRALKIGNPVACASSSEASNE